MQHLGVYNLVLVQGNINNFLSGVPLKVEIFYSVGTHLTAHSGFKDTLLNAGRGARRTALSLFI